MYLEFQEQTLQIALARSCFVQLPKTKLYQQQDFFLIAQRDSEINIMIKR